MEDFSTLVWLAIAVIWFLSRLVRRGAKKTSSKPKRPPRPTISRPAAPTEPRRRQPESQPEFTGRDGHGPPPIVPR